MPVVVVMPTETSDWFYPQRKRCVACRRYFGPLIIKRLYDSYECAGMVQPDPDVSTWPRYCRTRVNEPKVRYACPEEVSSRSHAGETVHVYECDHCGMWHIGHTDPNRDPQGPATTHLSVKSRQHGRRRR